MVVSLVVGALAATTAVGASAVAKASAATGLIGLGCGALGKGAVAGAFASVPAWGAGHGAFAGASAYAGVLPYGGLHYLPFQLPCAPWFIHPPPTPFLP